MKRTIHGMKQCIKIGIIVILAALVHNGALQAADVLCIPTSPKTECCLLSQAPTAQQTIQNFYHYFLTVSLCLEYVDGTQVPGNKSILLPANSFKMQLAAYSSEYDRLLFLSPHPMLDTSYYVFGLRKILI